MLKRIRFATRIGSADDFPSTWRAGVASALTAPPEARPGRVVACTVLSDVTPGAVHDGVGIEWFTDDSHLARFESWLASPSGGIVEGLLAEAVEVDASPVIVAEEHILRGEEWLAQRWRDGGEKLKHMAIARRAEGLTPAQFSDRWKSRAGQVGQGAIPDSARGLAYVQNHPLPVGDGSWAYDALNEVYFDDLAGVRTRMAFFASSPSEDDLVGENWFVVAREEVLGGGSEPAAPRVSLQ